MDVLDVSGKVGCLFPYNTIESLHGGYPKNQASETKSLKQEYTVYNPYIAPISLYYKRMLSFGPFLGRFGLQNTAKSDGQRFLAP